MRTRSQSRNQNRPQQQAPPVVVGPFNFEEPFDMAANGAGGAGPPPAGGGGLPVPDLQNMEELCQPSLNGQGGPITPITIQATTFGLKNDMIQQVQNSCPFGGPGDDANKYLDKFLHVTQSMKVNGVSDDALSVILKKLLEKLGDPEKFLISYGFSELKCKALADLGASINLMLLSVGKRVGLPSLFPTRMTLELANRDICTPKGIVRDVFVQVGKFTFPADFVINLSALLNHDPIKDMDSILEDSVDENSLADTISKIPVKSETYDDHLDFKEEKIKDSKILIDELDLPESNNVLPFLECDSVFYEDFSEVDALSSTNNEDKVFNPVILIHENLQLKSPNCNYWIRILKKTTKASLILEILNLHFPLYELLFHKEVPGLGAVLSFSSENEEKNFNPRILTSKRVHTSLLPELSHRGTKAFKVTKILESPMKIFPCSYQEDIRVLDGCFVFPLLSHLTSSSMGD
ncbi:reverse transcriptase domain-containing protein [Tanacetum coccineum]|uniref:Reverse transcriptase domain-containing protein n=1 Tax=Tanacetum coccineum TaxID=301880 RepID=A0ABQ5BIK3_9ASTR